MTQEKPPLTNEEHGAAETAEPVAEQAVPSAQAAQAVEVAAEEVKAELEENSVEAPAESPAEFQAEPAAQPAAQALEAEQPAEGEPMKGVGFLGRRGTAPIRTADSAHEEGAALSEGPAATHSPASPAPPAPPALKPGMAENTFRAMSYLGLLFLLLFLLVQTAAGIYFPSVFWPAEARLAEAYEAMIRSGQWLTAPPTAALPATLPGYFWFMGLVDAVPMLPDPYLLPAVAGLSALVALVGVYVLGLCTGLGNRVSFAAGLILLSSSGFVPLTHWVGPDMLLAGLLALSLGFLFKGWVSSSSFLWIGLGFVLAGLAALVGGLPALWIPLVGSCVFILWRGTLRRAHKLDAVLGFGLLLLCLTGWVGAVIIKGAEKAHVLQPLSQQLLTPLLPPYWPPLDPWWQGLALLGLGLLPWIFIPLFVSWGRVLGNALTDLKASRKDKSGAAWLWITLGVGVLLLVGSSTKPHFMAVPLLPLASLLLAKALLGLSATGSRLFFLFLAVLCLLGGIALAAVGIPAAFDMARGHLPPALAEILAASAGLPALGAILLLAALTLLKLTNRAHPGGALAVFVLLITMMVQPATLLTAPSLASAGFAVHLPKGLGLGILPDGKTPVAKPAAPSAEPKVMEPKATEPKAADPAPTPEPAKAPATTEAMPATPAVTPAPEMPAAVSPKAPEAVEAAPAEKLAPAPVPAPAPDATPPAEPAPAKAPEQAAPAEAKEPAAP